MTVTAKELKHRLHIQSVKHIPESSGGLETPEYTTLRKIWGNVHELSGREMFNHLPMNEGATHQVKMRFRTDIDTKMHLLWDRKRAPSVRLRVLSTREEEGALIVMCKLLEESA